jgi:hypothetical protein
VKVWIIASHPFHPDLDQLLRNLPHSTFLPAPVASFPPPTLIPANPRRCYSSSTVNKTPITNRVPHQQEPSQ